MNNPFRNQNINYDLLKEAGYKRYDQKIRNASALWQKKFQDQNGIKYHITFFEYDWREILNGSMDVISFEPSVQFEVDQDSCINVDFLVTTFHTIEQIEQFYEKMFTLMNFNYEEPKVHNIIESFEVCND